MHLNLKYTRKEERKKSVSQTKTHINFFFFLILFQYYDFIFIIFFFSQKNFFLNKKLKKLTIDEIKQKKKIRV